MIMKMNVEEKKYQNRDDLIQRAADVKCGRSSRGLEQGWPKTNSWKEGEEDLNKKYNLNASEMTHERTLI